MIWGYTTTVLLHGETQLKDVLGAGKLPQQKITCIRALIKQQIKYTEVRLKTYSLLENLGVFRQLVFRTLLKVLRQPCVS